MGQTPPAQILTQQLKLREVLLPIRKAALNEQLTPQDRLTVRWSLLLSTVLLFNLTLASLLWTTRATPKTRTTRAALSLTALSLATYKLALEWLNRDSLRALEQQRSDPAYYMRKLVLQQCGQDLGGRTPLLKKLNEQYESLYLLD